MRKLCSSIVLASLLLFTLPLLAQNESAVKGNLGGTISDSTGAVVSGAKVTLSGGTGNKTATTDGEGRFMFDLVVPGTYTVKAEMKGFTAAEVKGIEVFTGKTSSIRFNLQPGAVSETVEVTASAVTVDTASTSIGTNLNDTFYQALPIARNVTGLFYASAGVTSGGATGAANPSISGGSGLENQYVADGVNITDGGFGGIGVFSRNYGPLATGINLSFVKEVQVKTGGYEPQYGKSTGGIVQIVTKSGSNEYHGAIAGFFQPQSFERERLHMDDVAGRLNQGGKMLHQGAWDVSGELGGYVPGFKDKLFFFGSFNPSWTREYYQFADMHNVLPYTLLGNRSFDEISYNYSGKLTYKLNDSHTFESSIFGDPTRSNSAPLGSTTTFSDTGFSKVENGTRSWVFRYNGTLSPTWLVNASFSWGHNYLSEAPKFPDVYQVIDQTGRNLGAGGAQTSGIYARQGLGFYENSQGDNYAVSFDTQKIVHKLGEHTFSVGYRYEKNFYSGRRARTGARYTVTPNMAAAWDRQGIAPDLPGSTSDAAGFQLRIDPGFTGPGTGFPTVVTDVPGIGLRPVVLRQTRGEFGDPQFDTSGNYHAAYANDSWSIGHRITFNLGYRWEQQFMGGTNRVDPVTGQRTQLRYTFTDNWSPRVGISIDPWGDRKTKIYGNFARYSYAIPLDLAIRSLSAEEDSAPSVWVPTFDPATCDGTGNNCALSLNSDGTLVAPTFDDAHFAGPLGGIFISGTPPAHGTKMQYLQEWVGGFSRELPKGVILDVRFMDRRLRRVVEDMSGASPEASLAGVGSPAIIANPGPGLDLYVNPTEVLYPDVTNAAQRPAACNVPNALFADTANGNPVTDTFGNILGGVCITNPATAGALGSDGIPDGFVSPIRVYRAMEIELSRNFSKGWQWRTNYRWAELSGNYEGAFRNDNGQSDPSISSLFDFTAGQYGLLGQQFANGWLNTDRRHILNTFLSYTFTNTFLKNLTLGTGIRIEGGTPITGFKAHPVYQNAGEIPDGRRGGLGRTSTDGQADVHAAYTFNLGEKQRLTFGADMFNITNQRTLLRVDQNEDRSFGVPNVDFLKPVGRGGTVGSGGVAAGGAAYQRPFYARLMLKWQF